MADDHMKVSSQQASLVFADLLDSLIVDVASESHRAARLGFDYKLNVEEEEEVRLAHQARTIVGDSGAIGTENGNKHTIDVFGQTHPTIANETFECMNCGRPIVAGRFAPHLEKCMGKGRKARLKASRNMTTTQQRRARSSPISSYGGVASAARTPNRTPTRTPEEPQRGLTEATDGTSEESHDDDEKDTFYGLPRPGKARSKKASGRVWKDHRGTVMELSVSGWVPFPQVSSPGGRASNATLPAGNATFTGSVEGLTVEVAVEQFNSFLGGRVPTSGEMAFAIGPKQHRNARSPKVFEDTKRLGMILADGCVVQYCSGKRSSNEEEEGWKDTNEEVDAVIMTQCGSPGESGQGFQPHTGVSDEVKSDRRGELFSTGDDPHFKASSTDVPTGNVTKQPVTSTTSTAGSPREQCSGRLGLWEDPGQKSKLHLGGDSGDFFGGKRKKRLRATSKPKQYHAAVLAPTSGSRYRCLLLGGTYASMYHRRSSDG